MRKVLYLLVMLPMFIMSCSSDDEDVYVLTGTYSYQWHGMYVDEVYSYNIRFIDSEQYEFSYKSGDRIIHTNISTYILDYPNIHFKDFHSNIIKEDLDGVIIDDNTIRVESEEYTKR